eukprot:6177988-Pleurochrysis_carterae.AAC.2
MNAGFAKLFVEYSQYKSSLNASPSLRNTTKRRMPRICPRCVCSLVAEKAPRIQGVAVCGERTPVRWRDGAYRCSARCAQASQRLRPEGSGESCAEFSPRSPPPSSGRSDEG